MRGRYAWNRKKIYKDTKTFQIGFSCIFSITLPHSPYPSPTFPTITTLLSMPMSHFSFLFGLFTP